MVRILKNLKLWEWLFLLFIFLIPWQTRLILRPGILNGGNWEYGILGVYGTEMLLWLVVMVWGIEKILKREIKEITEIRKLRKLNIKKIISLISVISLISLSIFAAKDQMIAWQSWRYVFEAIVVFFLIRQFSRHDWLIYSFLSGLAVQSVLGIWQFLSQSTFASRWLGLTLHPAWQAGSAVLEGEFGRWLRAYGGLPHPNILGGYLVVGLFLIILIILKLSSDKRREIKEIKEIKEIRKLRKLSPFGRSPAGGDIKKMLLLTAYGLQLTALFFTFSRSAWIALFIGLIVYWFISWRKKIIFKSFHLLIFLSFFLFSVYCLLFTSLLSSRLSGEGRLEAQSTTERLSGYHEAWQLFKKHPLLGVGLGNYTLAVHQELDTSRPAWAYQPAHNIFLLMTVELGIVGLAFFCLLVFYFGKIFNIQYLPLRGISRRETISSILVLFFILGFFDHYLWSLYSGWMLLAVGGGLSFLRCHPPCQGAGELVK